MFTVWENVMISIEIRHTRELGGLNGVAWFPAVTEVKEKVHADSWYISHENLMLIASQHETKCIDELAMKCYEFVNKKKAEEAYGKKLHKLLNP